MRSLLAVAAVLLFSGGAAFASISVSGSAPMTDIMVSQPLADADPANSIDIRYASASVWRTCGQIFTAPADFALDKITLAFQVEPGRLNPMPVLINVYETDGVSSYAPNAGGILRTDTGTIAYTADTTGYVTFDVANLNMVSGHFYGFEVQITGPAASSKRFGDPGFLVSTATDPYAGGEPIRRNGEYNTTVYNTSNGSLDLVFYVQGQVPEPATMSLLALGALGLIRRRK